MMDILCSISYIRIEWFHCHSLLLVEQLKNSIMKYGSHRYTERISDTRYRSHNYEIRRSRLRENISICVLLCECSVLVCIIPNPILSWPNKVLILDTVQRQKNCGQKYNLASSISGSGPNALKDYQDNHLVNLGVFLEF